MASNGAVLTCTGMVDGQLIIFTNPQGDSSIIIFAVMASNPESSVERVCGIFQSLIDEKFPNCILNNYFVLNIVDLTSTYFLNSQ